MVKQLQIWSTVLMAVAVAQAGFGSGFGASLISRDKSALLETVHRSNAWLVIAVAAVCAVVAVLDRRRGGQRWPLVFAVCLVVGAVAQAMLGTFKIVGLHLFLGVLFLCAVTTFCSYAWRYAPRAASGPASPGS